MYTLAHKANQNHQDHRLQSNRNKRRLFSPKKRGHLILQQISNARIGFYFERQEYAIRLRFLGIRTTQEDRVSNESLVIKL